MEMNVVVLKKIKNHINLILMLCLCNRNCVWWHFKYGLHPSRKVSVQAWPRLQHRRDSSQWRGRMV